MRVIGSIGCILLLLAGWTGAPGAEPARRGVAGMAWLAGYWTGTADGLETEELWLPPRGGLMLGTHRDVGREGRAFFEFLRIETSGEGTVYRAQPSGRPATPFRLVEQEDTSLVFENLEHDFPQRILYQLRPDGTLLARIEGTVDGASRSREWTYRRSDRCALQEGSR